VRSEEASCSLLLARFFSLQGVRLDALDQGLCHGDPLLCLPSQRRGSPQHSKANRCRSPVGACTTSIVVGVFSYFRLFSLAVSTRTQASKFPVANALVPRHPASVTALLNVDLGAIFLPFLSN